MCLNSVVAAKGQILRPARYDHPSSRRSTKRKIRARHRVHRSRRTARQDGTMVNSGADRDVEIGFIGRKPIRANFRRRRNTARSLRIPGGAKASRSQELFSIPQLRTLRVQFFSAPLRISIGVALTTDANKRHVPRRYHDPLVPAKVSFLLLRGALTLSLS